ncbi:uracil-DNA glycosylase [Agreia sp. Leaf335]|uniref:uracil-DNA glycosylase n=1 Tax=Agreia sp. Leaf335 TaxID=1736340 RepID=UPI0009E72419
MNDLLTATVAFSAGPNACNFYQDDSDTYSPFVTTAGQRRAAFQAFYERVEGTDLILVGEAAGWRGARQSGIPFTSPTDVGLPGTTEASATVVQAVLDELRIHHRVLLWNAFPLHPFKPGAPASNRTPTRSELISSTDLLDLAVQRRKIVCVGRSAANAVEGLLGVSVRDAAISRPSDRAVSVRHPSYGGGPRFRSGLAAAMKIWDVRDVIRPV